MKTIKKGDVKGKFNLHKSISEMLANLYFYNHIEAKIDMASKAMVLK